MHAPILFDAMYIIPIFNKRCGSVFALVGMYGL